MKLDRTIFLGFGLKEWKMAEKLVKRETSLCSFAKVGLKEGENISQRCEISCASLLSNGDPNL